MKIPIARTEFTAAEFEAIRGPLESGWVVQGPHVAAFENKWCQFTGAAHSVAVSSCTAGLHLSLAALGIGRGDEVIVPAFTWVATANAVEAVGATPIFCDIDLSTFNIDTAMAASLITAKTRAIVPVHLFGLAAEMDSIADLAARYRLAIIEDAACGFGSRYKGQHVGTCGTCGCFSFHPRKAITTGEGGMVTTDDAELAAKLRAMREHGATRSDYERHHGAHPAVLPDFPYLGFNFRMTDLQGALGSAQMDRADEIHRRRCYFAGRYNELLTEIPWLVPPTQPKHCVHGFQAYVCLFAPEDSHNLALREIKERRNKLMEYLQQIGISTRPGTHAVHLLEFYRNRYGLEPEAFPSSLRADHASIAFPLFPQLSEEEFSFIAEALSGYRP